jgi:ABC-type phosphate transport system substrate-binding protein
VPPAHRFRLPVAAVIAASLLTLPARGAGQGAESFRVIVNPTNPVVSLSAKEASDLLMSKTNRWPDNTPVKPVDQSTTSPVRVAFTRDVHGKKIDAVVNYWQQVIFSGRGLPPPAKTSDQEVLAYVKANPGAIGYVSLEAPVAGVKVVPIKP